MRLACGIRHAAFAMRRPLPVPVTVVRGAARAWNGADIMERFPMGRRRGVGSLPVWPRHSRGRKTNEEEGVAR